MLVYKTKADHAGLKILTNPQSHKIRQLIGTLSNTLINIVTIAYCNTNLSTVIPNL